MSLALYLLGLYSLFIVGCWCQLITLAGHHLYTYLSSALAFRSLGEDFWKWASCVLSQLIPRATAGAVNPERKASQKGHVLLSAGSRSPRSLGTVLSKGLLPFSLPRWCQNSWFQLLYLFVFFLPWQSGTRLWSRKFWVCLAWPPSHSQCSPCTNHHKMSASSPPEVGQHGLGTVAGQRCSSSGLQKGTWPYGSGRCQTIMLLLSNPQQKHMQPRSPDSCTVD